MQGQHTYQNQLFFYADMESLIPKSHILRKISQVLNLSFIKEMTAPYYNESQGRPSIDPEVFFRMLIVGYLYGISSDRRLCEEIGYNLAYRWFCGLNLEDKVPDHSSLTRIRDRLGEEIFSIFFAQIIDLCKKHGLLKGDEIIVDATLIDADAGLDSLVADDDLQARQEAQDFQNRTSLDPIPRRKISNKTHTSQTDPDSSLAHKKGTARKLKYKVHNSIDAHSRIILDTHVTTGKVHDSQPFLGRLLFLRDVGNHTVSQVIADRAYGSLESLLSLEKQGIKPYIPLFSRKSGLPNTNLEGFIYNPEKDHFVCPQGAILTGTDKHYNNLKAYCSKVSDCRDCPQKDSCRATRKHKHARYVRRNIHQPFIEGVVEDMSHPLFAEKMKERRWKVEGIFAEAKNNHGLRRAKYRGIHKVQIQAFMTAAVQNLKRIINLFKCILGRKNGLFVRITSEIHGRIEFDIKNILSIFLASDTHKAAKFSQ